MVSSGSLDFLFLKFVHHYCRETWQQGCGRLSRWKCFHELDAPFGRSARTANGVRPNILMLMKISQVFTVNINTVCPITGLYVVMFTQEVDGYIIGFFLKALSHLQF